MRKVILKTATGELVSEIFVIPFTSPPDVLIWGQRVFKFVKETGDTDEYLEAFAYWVPTTMV